MKKKNGMSHSLIHSTLQSTKVKCVLFMSIICNFFNNAVCLKTKNEHTPKKKSLNKNDETICKQRTVSHDYVLWR